MVNFTHLPKYSHHCFEQSLHTSFFSHFLRQILFETMVKFIHLADSLHRRLFNQILHTSFLDIFLVYFSVNFESSLPQMLKFYLKLRMLCF